MIEQPTSVTSPNTVGLKSAAAAGPVSGTVVNIPGTRVTLVAAAVSALLSFATPAGIEAVARLISAFNNACPK
jgi:hypothetical protein